MELLLQYKLAYALYIANYHPSPPSPVLITLIYFIFYSMADTTFCLLGNHLQGSLVLVPRMLSMWSMQSSDSSWIGTFLRAVFVAHTLKTKICVFLWAKEKICLLRVIKWWFFPRSMFLSCDVIRTQHLSGPMFPIQNLLMFPLPDELCMKGNLVSDPTISCPPPATMKQ